MARDTRSNGVGLGRRLMARGSCRPGRCPTRKCVIPDHRCSRKRTPSAAGCAPQSVGKRTPQLQCAFEAQLSGQHVGARHHCPDQVVAQQIHGDFLVSVRHSADNVPGWPPCPALRRWCRLRSSPRVRAMSIARWPYSIKRCSTSRRRRQVKFKGNRCRALQYGPVFTRHAARLSDTRWHSPRSSSAS